MHGWENRNNAGGQASGANIHRFSMPRLLENLRRHIPRRPTRRRQHMKRLLIHNPRQPKIRNQQIRVILRRPEQQVLGLEVAVYDAMVVEVGNGRESGADEVGGVGFVIGAFAADAVEELAAEGEVRY